VDGTAMTSIPSTHFYGSGYGTWTLCYYRFSWFLLFAILSEPERMYEKNRPKILTILMCILLSC
jgi:hypothetical protein